MAIVCILALVSLKGGSGDDKFPFITRSAKVKFRRGVIVKFGSGPGSPPECC